MTASPCDCILESFTRSCEHLRVRAPNKSLLRLLTAAAASNELHIDTYVGNRNLLVAAEVVSVCLPQLRTFRVTGSPLFNSEDKPNSVDGNTAVQGICALLARHPTLETVDLSASLLGTIALVHLAELARATPSISSIPLSDRSRKECNADQLSLLDAYLEVNQQKQRIARAHAADSASQEKNAFFSGASSVHSQSAMNVSRRLSPTGSKSSEEALPLSAGVGTGLVATDLAKRLNIESRTINQKGSSRGGGGGVKMTRPCVSITYEYSVPYRLSQRTMRCVQEKSLFSLDELPVRLPHALSNIKQTAAKDGKADPPVGLIRHAHARHYPKTPEERARLREMITQSSHFRSFQFEIFPEPRPPAQAVTIRSVSAPPSAQQMDYEVQLAWVETQREEWIQSMIDCMHLTVVNAGEVLSEIGDTVTRVFMIDAVLSPHAVVEHWARPGGAAAAAAVSDDATAPSSSGPVKWIATYGAGQWIGTDELIPTDSATPPPTKRHATLHVRSYAQQLGRAASMTASTVAATSAPPTGPVHIWELSAQCFQTMVAEPMFRHRTEWRRLADAMPALLGTDVLLRASLADVLHATTTGTFFGDEGVDEHVILTSGQLKTSVAIVEEGQLELFTVEEGVSIGCFSRGALVSIPPSNTVPLTLKTLSGNMPSWRCALLTKEDIQRSLPLELQELLLVKKATDVQAMLDATSSQRERIRQAATS